MLRKPTGSTANATAQSSRRELAEVAKTIAEIVRRRAGRLHRRALSERLAELEAKQDGLTARLSDVPLDVPDLHPGITETFRRRIQRLTEALDHPDDAAEATATIRGVIDRIVITPCREPGYKPAPDTASYRLSRAWHLVPLSPSARTACLFSPSRP